MTTQQLAEIAALEQVADNCAHAAKIPMPDSLHKPQLEAKMEEIRDRLRKLFIEIAGHNPWEEPPMARYYAKEFAPGRWHVHSRDTPVPIYDDARDGNDKPLVFDEDSALDCVDRLNNPEL